MSETEKEEILQEDWMVERPSLQLRLVHKCGLLQVYPLSAEEEVPSIVPREGKILTIKLRYPTYEQELAIRKEATNVDGMGNTSLDIEVIRRERARYCLLSWDFHKVLGHPIKKIVAQNKMLTDESMDQWQNLVPPLRKAVSNLIDDFLGGL